MTAATTHVHTEAREIGVGPGLSHMPTMAVVSKITSL